LWLMERITGYVPMAVAVYLALAVAIMACLALAVAFRRDRSARASVACLSWLLVVFLILMSPHYPWYFLVLVPLLAIQPSATAWVLTLTCPLLYDSVEPTGWPSYDARIVAFTAATLVALAYDSWCLRRNSLDRTIGEMR
jgi:alpha-1,6-mannosyltransferase